MQYRHAHKEHARFTYQWNSQHRGSLASLDELVLFFAGLWLDSCVDAMWSFRQSVRRRTFYFLLSLRLTDTLLPSVGTMARASASSPLAARYAFAWTFVLVQSVSGFVADRHVGAVHPASTFSSSSSRTALVYMPDGTVMKDDDEDLEATVSALESSMLESDLSQRSQDALLKHLNAKNMRGPLAILSAANGNIDLGSIESVAVRGISSTSVHIEAICSREDQHCVNVPVIINFPTACASDGEIIAACNEAYQEANAKLERAKVKTGLVVSFNSGRGYGFISLKMGPDVYVHQSNIKMEGYRTLRVGQTVEFKTGTDTKRGTGREYAYDVVPLKEGGATISKASIAGNTKKRARQEFPAKVDVEKPKASKSKVREEKVKPTKAKHGAKEKDNANTSDAKNDSKRLQETLASKPSSRDYASMEVGERAFHVLLDLGLITLTPDPDDPDYDHSKDDEFADFTTIG